MNIIYNIHPNVAMVQNIIAGMKQKTGKSLEEWVDLVRGSGLQDKKETMVWLKADFKLGTNYATWIVDFAEGTGLEWVTPDPDAYIKVAFEYVESMYSGAKAHLRPLYDRLIRLGQELGNDVKFCPTKTYVPFYRYHVFAQVKPTTTKRIDFGLSLGNPNELPPSKRLIDTGGFAKKDRITHRIALANVEEIDDEVQYWLEVAYNRDK